MRMPITPGGRHWGARLERQSAPMALPHPSAQQTHFSV